MQSIGTLFNIDSIPTKKKINSERAFLVSQFIERLNVNAGQKYKDATGAWKVTRTWKASEIGFFLSHLNMTELYYFFSDCKQASCGFSRAFWAGVRIGDKWACKEKRFKYNKGTVQTKKE